MIVRLDTESLAVLVRIAAALEAMRKPAPRLLEVLKDAVADAEKAANPEARFHQYHVAKAAIAEAEGVTP